MNFFSSISSKSSRLVAACVPCLGDSLIQKRKTATMPPGVNIANWLRNSIKTSTVLVFSKTTCPFCVSLKKTFNENKIRFAALELDKLTNGREIQSHLETISGCKTVPQVFIRGDFIGGASDTLKLHEEGKLLPKINDCKYDYDLVVIGGGSGGLAASKEASAFGAKVAVLDFVKPTPKGTTWGLGGTCVNVGCIPKKLMHTAAIFGHGLEDAKNYGWQLPEKNGHSWSTMVEQIQNHIASLNWGYRVVLREKMVTYLNAYGILQDAHTIKTVNKQGKESVITTDKIILAMGERPRYPGIPGDKEYGISSDDLFSLRQNPGRTLIVGASYVALECAGFLTALGVDTSVMVRSILLRGFDQQMANMAGDYMERHGTRFIRECVPTEVRQKVAGDPENNKLPVLEVIGQYTSGERFCEEYNTVVFAIGRDPCTSGINLEGVGVKLDKAGRVICTDAEETSVENIYAIGDIVAEKLQLTPVAIQAGRYLAHRMYNAGTKLTDYTNVATTVFTPLEYSCIGLSEEDAIKKYGQSGIEVYHSFFKPLEWTVAHREDNTCYAKLICNKNDSNRVIGFHVLSPNAGEIAQGFAIGFRLGATKDDFDSIIGIHPTCAEIFTTLHVTKSSGASAETTGC